MESKLAYVPFLSLFDWCVSSKIGSRQGKKQGKYKLYISSATEIKRYDDYLEDGDSLVFGTGGNPSIHLASGKFAYTNHTECAKSRDKNINLKYYYYYFQMNNFLLLRSTFVGGGIKNSSKKKIGALLVPKLPLEEQNRIVKQIEEQLSQLDSAVETLQKTKQQLEVYRQAVLKEAFQHFTSIKPIREKASLVTSGSRGWAKFYNDKGARFIRIGNLNRENININLQDVQYVKLPDNAEGTRSKLEAGDILVSITADLGSIGLVRENIGEAYINQHIALVRLKNKIQSEFIAWYLRSDIGQKQLLKNKRGAGKLGLGLDDIRDTLIPDVSSEIAFITIRKIEEKLSVCNSIEQTVNQSLQQAEALRQSILKHAFEGE